MSGGSVKKAQDILLVTEDEYLKVLLPLLDEAKKTVDIMAYSFAMASASGRIDYKGGPYEIAEKLKEIKQKRKNLKIRLYVEGIRETSIRNRVTAEILKTHGVEVVYGATHAKGVCVDRKYVLFGSTNLTNQSLRKNHETNILIGRKEVTTQFMRYFEHLWNGGQHGGIELKPPMYADGSFKDMLLEMIHTAKKSLEFSIYFFDHREIREAFIQAHGRGVEIKGFVHDHGSFALGYVRRTRRTVHIMEDSGITDLHFAPNHLFTHSKYLIKDRQEVALGTGNWLMEDVEIHPQLYIHLKEPALARELSRHLKNQINNKPWRGHYNDFSLEHLSHVT
jgi:phosphatidylserine/phosphatidylglycerophosphate/cardiolipin synthase-like enzyme